MQKRQAPLPKLMIFNQTNNRTQKVTKGLPEKEELFANTVYQLGPFDINLIHRSFVQRGKNYKPPHSTVAPGGVEKFLISDVAQKEVEANHGGNRPHSIHYRNSAERIQPALTLYLGAFVCAKELRRTNKEKFLVGGHEVPSLVYSLSFPGQKQLLSALDMEDPSWVYDDEKTITYYANEIYMEETQLDMFYDEDEEDGI